MDKSYILTLKQHVQKRQKEGVILWHLAEMYP